jgi:hypothetical protein
MENGIPGWSQVCGHVSVPPPHGQLQGEVHGLINYIDTIAKCRHIKKFTCKGTLRQVVYPSEAPSPHNSTPPPPSLCKYTLLCHREGGTKGRVEPERRLEGQQFTKLGWKFKHDWLYLQSTNSDKHLPQSPFTQVNFLNDGILLWCFIVN